MKNILTLLVAFTSFINITNAQWKDTHGPFANPIECLAISGTKIFAGTDNNGIYASSNNGASWSQVTDTGMMSYSGINAIVVNDSNIFAAAGGAGVFRSTDDGATWLVCDSGLGNYPIVQTVSINGNKIFIANYDGIFSSSDNGKSWSPLPDSLPYDIVESFAFIGNNIIAGTAGQLYLSNNNGLSWTNVKPITTSFRALVLDSSYVFAATDNGVYLSADSGVSWSQVNAGLTDTFVSSLAVSGTNILAGTYTGGVYLSTNNGKTWSTFNTGLTDTTILSITINGPYIFAGTSNGTGVWKRALSDVLTSVEEFTNKEAITAYPNPASNQLAITTSSFYENERANLFITNVLGQVLYLSLITNPKSEIDVSFLPQGIYILEVVGERERFVGRFVKE